MVFIQLQKESQVRITAELAKKPQQQKRKQTKKKNLQKITPRKNPTTKNLLLLFILKPLQGNLAVNSSRPYVRLVLNYSNLAHSSILGLIFHIYSKMHFQ